MSYNCGETNQCEFGLSEKSIKVLCPDYFVSETDTPSYKRWRESGLSKAAYNKKFNCCLGRDTSDEFFVMAEEKKKELFSALKEFLARHKSEIWAELESAKTELFSQFTQGCDVFIDTLQGANKKTINSLLRIGYKVRCSTASGLALYYDKEEKPTFEQMKQIYPEAFKEFEEGRLEIEIDGVVLRYEVSELLRGNLYGLCR